MDPARHRLFSLLKSRRRNHAVCGIVETLEQTIDALRAELPHLLIRDREAIGQRMERLMPPRNPEAVVRQMERLLERARQSRSLVEARREAVPEIRFPEELPITSRLAEVAEAMRTHPVVIVAGETGSGKTTQLPKLCLQAGYGCRGRIACTQPRRVAALSVSRRIAEELNVTWGREVGAKIRFTDQTGPETFIKMMTDGMLLSEIQGDPDLLDYEVIILDEAHERSLNIDFLLGYLKQLRTQRPDLRILITSATIDTVAFSKAFDDAPIIEVSGRTFPVDVVYAPIDELLEDSGEFTYIEAAAQAVENIVHAREPGDILIFLPGEKDIRELRDVLDGRTPEHATILPLFGRLSNAEQQRIFAPARGRKIVLATNIAETSLTIPGIRFVIDSGLARISRYNPNTHTQRLPIERVAQSSANQRKGRAGRVQDGVCIRLYDEKDFLSRPEYATPEILRSNLAAVILRMIAFRIGDVETFPFVDPPQERAIRAGYQLLQELGALDTKRQLTPLGRRLAHLPVDPTVGRMLLEANREGSLREVLVIAAGLSIQDPRERPMDKQDAADQMHRKFLDERSDFLSLLNIWNAYHDETERLSQGQLRKFCRSHFLSYIRMREWRDIYQQLSVVLKDLGEFRMNPEPAEYHSIHRALLTGLLANVAEKDSGNFYKGTHNRNVMLFPGSCLFDRKAAKAARKKAKGGNARPQGESASRTPPWIMCAEWMETNRLYARTVAAIENRWIEELGAHVLKASYSDPRYEEQGERVVVRERQRLHGLEVAARHVGYVKINPDEATDIFIRHALVAGELKTRFLFLEHNREVRQRVEDLRTRLRSSSVWSLDEHIHDFYAKRLRAVGSVHDLHRWLKERNGDDAQLRLDEARLVADLEEDDALMRFPDRVEMSGVNIPLNYAYKPGEEDDGATLRVPVEEFSSVDPSLIDWAVPGYIEEKVDHLMRGLPKDLRRQLFPIQDKARELTLLLDPSKGGLIEQLTSLIESRYGIRILRDRWNEEAIPDHLKTRVEVVDRKDRVIVSGRDWKRVSEGYRDEVRRQAKEGKGNERLELWQRAQARFEKHGLSTWSFDDLPEQIRVGDLAGLPLIAWPGLRLEDDASVSLVLFTNPQDARSATPAAFAALCEKATSSDVGWMEKDLKKEMKRVRLALAAIMPPDRMYPDALRCLKHSLFHAPEPLPLRRELFDTVTQRARKQMRGLVPVFVDLLESILGERDKLLPMVAKAPVVEPHLNRLLNPNLFLEADYEDLQQMPRYLKALARRAERAALDPRKDAEKARTAEPYLKPLSKMDLTRDPMRPFRWMVEEFLVSLFAQELGTRQKVSPKRLDAALRQVQDR